MVRDTCIDKRPGMVQDLESFQSQQCFVFVPELKVFDGLQRYVRSQVVLHILASRPGYRRGYDFEIGVFELTCVYSTH